MGILGLSKLVADLAPQAVKESDIKNYFGRKVAIDASMSLYQFLIAVRSSDGAQLTNSEGETTSHLMGTFYRTIRMIENGIKPVYVFDGKPPDMKSGELEKRSERRAEAEAALQKAKEDGDAEEVDRQNRRLVKVGRSHVQDCQKLLRLMGVPFVEAPCEAEAQCAELVRSGKVFAAGTEDMDALTFGASVLLRHLTFSEARKMPIREYRLDRILEGMDLSMDQFVDLCILLGCDYCEKIKGVGPKNAIKLIQEHGSIEGILKNAKLSAPPPEDWSFAQARRLFKEPEVAPGDSVDLKWEKPDEEGLVKFMVEVNGFAEDRIRNGAKKLAKARQGTTQGRLDSFFKVLPTSGNNSSSPANGKRKSSDDEVGKSAASSKKAKPAKNGGRYRR